jgi:hypothetical protein
LSIEQIEERDANNTGVGGILGVRAVFTVPKIVPTRG